MSATTIGIISDTHLPAATEQFKKLIEVCFAETSIIFHAGDVTDISVLDVFAGKEVHGVHGNMCRASVCNVLPKQKVVAVGRYLVAITHGMQYGMKHADFIEGQLLLDFPEADCIIYGHTHIAVCRKIGNTLIMNPGSFSPGGTYGIIQANNGLHGRILQVPRL